MDEQLRKVLVVVIFSILVVGCHGQITSDEALFNDEDADTKPLLTESSNEMTTEKVIQMVEEIALAAEKSSKIDSSKDADIYYEDMVKVLDDIIHAIKDRTRAYEFLKSKGLNRVISANLGIDHQEMKTKLLTLLKTLFEVAPATTNALIPKGIVTRLLDIFENNPNLALKTHALEILHKWLPNNPEIQMRVMKLKGLEPFYTQINKLDISVIQTLLDLFNTILKEHVEARSEKAQVTKIDNDRRVMYQKIGLLERMETANVCNGLVNILQVVWAYNKNGELVKIVLDLIKNSKPFCEETLRGKTNAVALLENILKFVKNEDKKEFFEDIGLDATVFGSILEDYVDKVKTPKDEF